MSNREETQQIRSSSPCLKFLPLLLAVLQLATGCATHKQTWTEWMQATNAVYEPSPYGVTELSPGATNFLYRPGYQKGQGAMPGPGFDLEARNEDFPATHIAAIQVDLTAPSNAVHLVWTGPHAAEGPTGPWRSSAGRGQPCYDCDTVEDSNTVDSWCTPKGTFLVVGFDDRLKSVPSCRYATWVIHEPRYVAIHSHSEIPAQAVSHGCIRVPFEVAKLIHNNSIAGETRVHIYGEWTRPIGLRDESIDNRFVARGPRI